jgi:hypothetical protein
MTRPRHRDEKPRHKAGVQILPPIVGNKPTALKAKKAQKRWPALGHKVRFAALSRWGGPFPHPGFANQAEA